MKWQRPILLITLTLPLSLFLLPLPTVAFLPLLPTNNYFYRRKKMAKKTLDFDIEDHIDFELIGIICAHKDFRLCYEINNLLGIELRKTNDLEIKLEKKGSSGTFSLYQYINADDEQIYLVANKGNHTLFIPEQKHIDYFIMIRNRSPFTKIPELITKLKTINLINSVLPIEAVKLKSADHFLYIEPEESN